MGAMRTCAVLTGAVALIACGRESSGTAKAAARAETPAESQDSLMLDWADSGCDELQELPDLAGLSTELVTQRLGQPEQRESFRIGERPDEFRIGLQNTYPLTEPENANVEVMEWTWENGDCKLTIWFHQVDQSWQSLNNLRWHRDMEF